MFAIRLGFNYISLKKNLKGRFEITDRGRMTDRNSELAPDNWSLLREGTLTAGLCSEGWYSEHSGVCRRTEPIPEPQRL